MLDRSRADMPDAWRTAASDPTDTEAIPDDQREALMDCAARAGAKYDGFGDFTFPPMDANEVLALMTGIPLPARYGEAWRNKFARLSPTSTAHDAQVTKEN